MRKIRLVVGILVVFGVVFPQITLADETIKSDINIKNTFEIISDFFAPSPVLAEETAKIETVQEQVVVAEPEKTEEELKNEAILAKWKLKQAEKWNNLPQGQFVINASAYTASADECDNNLGITASGIKVKEKRTIACPPEFPFGVKIEIEGQGTFVCEDRGGAIKGNHVDIYVQTKAEAFKFGRRNLVAQVVE